jgi:hypothetical protein
MNAVLREVRTAKLCPLMRFEPPMAKKKTVEYAKDVWMRIFMEKRACASRPHRTLHDLNDFMTS